MKTITIAGQKGGTGKTTTALEIASILGKRGYRVLAIDMDQQRNLSTYSGCKAPSPSIYDALHAKVPFLETVQHMGNFDISPASAELSKADREFVDQDDVFLLLDLVRSVSHTYDFVIVDNSPSRNVLLTMSYIAADGLVIPAEADKGSFDGVMAVYADVAKLRTGRMVLSHCSVDGLVLTKYENTIAHQMALDEMERMSKEVMASDAPFVATIRKSIVATEAKRVLKPLSDYAPGSKPSADYERLVDEILRKGGA